MNQAPRARFVVAFLLASLSFPLPPVASARKWTTTLGQAIEGEFVRVHGTNVVLKAGRRIFTVPLSYLSQSDQLYIKELQQLGRQSSAAESGSAASGRHEIRGWAYSRLLEISEENARFEGRFVGVDGDTVTIDTGTKHIAVRIEELTGPDREYILDWLREPSAPVSEGSSGGVAGAEGGNDAESLRYLDLNAIEIRGAEPPYLDLRASEAITITDFTQNYADYTRFVERLLHTAQKLVHREVGPAAKRGEFETENQFSERLAKQMGDKEDCIAQLAMRLAVEREDRFSSGYRLVYDIPITAGSYDIDNRIFSEIVVPIPWCIKSPPNRSLLLGGRISIEEKPKISRALVVRGVPVEIERAKELRASPESYRCAVLLRYRPPTARRDLPMPTQAPGPPQRRGGFFQPNAGAVPATTEPDSPAFDQFFSNETFYYPNFLPEYVVIYRGVYGPEYGKVLASCNLAEGSENSLWIKRISSEVPTQAFLLRPWEYALVSTETPDHLHIGTTRCFGRLVESSLGQVTFTAAMTVADTAKTQDHLRVLPEPVTRTFPAEQVKLLQVVSRTETEMQRFGKLRQYLYRPKTKHLTWISHPILITEDALLFYIPDDDWEGRARTSANWPGGTDSVDLDGAFDTHFGAEDGLAADARARADGPIEELLSVVHGVAAVGSWNSFCESIATRHPRQTRSLEGITLSWDRHEMLIAPRVRGDQTHDVFVRVAVRNDRRYPVYVAILCGFRVKNGSPGDTQLELLQWVRVPGESQVHLALTGPYPSEEDIGRAHFDVRLIALPELSAEVTAASLARVADTPGTVNATLRFARILASADYEGMAEAIGTWDRTQGPVGRLPMWAVNQLGRTTETPAREELLRRLGEGLRNLEREIERNLRGRAGWFEK